MTSEKLKQIYDLLFARFGKQCWWPGDSTDEIVVGAILTQNTNWQNVEKAINNLKAAGMMSLSAINGLQADPLAELIRPAGYYNVKAKRLKNFLKWIFDNYAGELAQLEKQNTETLRAELLGINGIGRETADSILLYAFGRPVFVVDAYTFRMAFRHGLIDEQCDYEELRRLFEDNIAYDAKIFNEYHALLVKLGKEYCKPKAKCTGCPLEKMEHHIQEEY